MNIFKCLILTQVGGRGQIPRGQRQRHFQQRLPKVSGAQLVPNILKLKEGNANPRQSAQVFLHPLHCLVFRFQVVPGV